MSISTDISKWPSLIQLTPIETSHSNPSPVILPPLSPLLILPRMLSSEYYKLGILKNPVYILPAGYSIWQQIFKVPFTEESEVSQDTETASGAQEPENQEREASDLPQVGKKRKEPPLSLAKMESPAKKQKGEKDDALSSPSLEPEIPENSSEEDDVSEAG